jgi:protein-S-isoprenylcysteine O-methyltransferase Ste14
MSSYIDSLCEYICWIFNFKEGGRLIWLSFLWFIFEFITRVIARKNETSEGDFHLVKLKDRGSWWFIALSSTMMAVIILGVLHLRKEPDLPTYFIPIGIVLMILGIILRIWAVVTLGKFFTMKVTIFSNHHLIDKGPYRLLQHPSYSGVFITTIGLGLATGYLIVLITFLIILGFALGYRIYVEEKALKEEFGEEWIRYSAKTWKILPWIL